MLKVIKGNRDQLVSNMKEAFQNGLLAPAGAKKPFFDECIQIDKRLSARGSLKQLPPQEESSSE